MIENTRYIHLHEEINNIQLQFWIMHVYTSHMNYVYYETFIYQTHRQV